MFTIHLQVIVIGRGAWEMAVGGGGMSWPEAQQLAVGAGVGGWWRRNLRLLYELAAGAEVSLAQCGSQCFVSSVRRV